MFYLVNWVSVLQPLPAWGVMPITLLLNPKMMSWWHPRYCSILSWFLNAFLPLLCWLSGFPCTQHPGDTFIMSWSLLSMILLRLVPLGSLVTYGQVVILGSRRSGDNQLLQFLKKNFKSCSMLFLLMMSMDQKKTRATVPMKQTMTMILRLVLLRMMIILSSRKRLV